MTGGSNIGRRGLGLRVGHLRPPAQIGIGRSLGETLESPSMEKITSDAKWLTRKRTQATLIFVNECKRKHMGVEHMAQQTEQWRVVQILVREAQGCGWLAIAG